MFQLQYSVGATSVYLLVGTGFQYSDTSQILIGYHILIGKIWDVVVSILIMPWAGPLSNHGPIPGWG
jgi:hypothetical protein